VKPAQGIRHYGTNDVTKIVIFTAYDVIHL